MHPSVEDKIDDEDTILICDMNQLDVPVAHAGITIILSSPNNLRYKEAIMYIGESLVMNPLWVSEVMIGLLRKGTNL